MSFFTNIKSLWITIIVLIILNIVLTGSIWLTKEHRPFTRSGAIRGANLKTPTPHRGNFLIKELNFNIEQQSEFDTLAAKHNANLNAINDEIKALREQLVNRMKNQAFDSVSEGLIQDIGQKQAELELINFRNFRDIMSICDAEQKEKFLEIMRRAFRPGLNGRGRNGDFERRGKPGPPQ
jgi:hypothetical protein